MPELSDEELMKLQVKSFVNSDDPVNALKRLAQNLPINILRRVIWSYLNTVVSILAAMGRIVGLELSKSVTDTDIENKSKQATENVVTITKLYVEIFKEPRVRENIKELAKALNESALRPFLIGALLTFEEMKPAIDQAQEELIEKYKEGLRRLGDGTTDALENVISGIPGYGNAWSAFSGAMSALQAVQASVDTSSAIILQTTYRILQLMKKMNVPGLDAVNSLIETGIKGQNVLNTVTNKVDAANAAAADITFTPKPMETTKTFAAAMEKEADKSREAYNEKVEEATSKAAVAKGGSRKRKRRKSNRKTRKR
tara:strand:- start:1322 stop:2263 length:942 start_codon:yes stop_codon:yes gene_type:complete